MISFHWGPNLSAIVRKPIFKVSDQVRHKRAVQLQKQYGWRFEISDLYCLSRANKGADQLHGYHASDVRLCFHMQKAGFLMIQLISFYIFKVLGWREY